MKMTITEALAKIKLGTAKTIHQRDTMAEYVCQDRPKDPLYEQGGSAKFLTEKMQSIRDIGEDLLELRRAIAKANSETLVTIGETTMTISDWLIWKREVAPALINVYETLYQRAIRGRRLASPVVTGKPEFDVIIHIDEKGVAAEIERLQTVLGELDGQLSLKNAVTMVEVE